MITIIVANICSMLVMVLVEYRKIKEIATIQHSMQKFSRSLYITNGITKLELLANSKVT